MKALTRSTKPFGRKMTERTTLFSVIFTLLVCSTVYGSIDLTVNGNDPAVFPLELKSNESMEIALVDSDSAETSYDLTLSATGGVFLCEDPAGKSFASSQLLQKETVNIQTSDLTGIGDIYFEFQYDSVAAIIGLTTNQSLTINNQMVPADTEIYQLILFDMDDDRVVVFGVNYDSLSYEPPLEEKSTTESLEASSLESLDFDSESMILPPVIEPNEPEPVFLQCPAASSGLMRDEVDSFAEWSQQVAMLEMLDSEPNVYVIDSDITENHVWDANNIYYIVGDPNNWYIVDVNSLLVIEPGTTVIMGYQSGLHVSDGGTLIAKGTPDKPIVFTPDWVFFDCPDNIGYYWQVYGSYGPYYHCPIYVEETASPLTTIQYCMIEGAIGGVITNNIRLSQPIENNYLFGNVWGVYEYGPLLTDVRNNLCFYQDQAAIEIELCPDPNGFADLNHAAKIEHNTCDGYGYTCCGITVHGVADPNSSGIPTIYLTNNIVTSNDNYGLNLVDGAMYALVISTGYFDNDYNKNWEFDEYNPVVTETNPYYPYILDPYQHHYLIDDADFVDAGLQYIERSKLIGTKTNADNVPDKDIVDLGFHHSMWDYVGGEGIAGTDIDDLIEISDYWLEYSPFEPNSPGYINPNLYIYDPNHPELWIDPNFVTFGGDWNDDSYVDLADFAIMAQTWKAAPAEPNIIPIISGDPDNGWIEVDADGLTPKIQDVFVFLSGRYVGKIPVLNDERPLEIDISECGSLPQQLKLIAMDYDGHITASHLTDITFPSTLSYCILPDSYETNEPIPFAAYTTEPNVASSINVYADSGILVWSQVFDGNSISGSIPANIATDYGIGTVEFRSNSGANVLKTTTAALPALSTPDPNIIALIVTPYRSLSWRNGSTYNAVKTAFENRGVKYLRLNGKAATYANIAKYAPQLKYLYIDSHGNSAVQDGMNGVLRTFVALADVDCVSAKASDFVGTPPTWCKDPLPGRKETTLKSFVTMGFTDLRFFFNDSCLGAHLTIDSGTGLLMWGGSGEQSLFDFVHNDMSVACGLTNTSESRFYQGWFCESWSRFWPETDFQQFSRQEWEALGNGEELYWAVLEAIWQQDSFGPDDPAYNYRIKGQGDPQNFRIRSNP